MKEMVISPDSGSLPRLRMHEYVQVMMIPCLAHVSIYFFKEKSFRFGFIKQGFLWRSLVVTKEVHCDLSTLAWDLMEMKESGYVIQGYIPSYITYKNVMHQNKLLSQLHN